MLIESVVFQFSMHLSFQMFSHVYASVISIQIVPIINISYHISCSQVNWDRIEVPTVARKRFSFSFLDREELSTDNLKTYTYFL